MAPSFMTRGPAFFYENGSVFCVPKIKASFLKKKLQSYDTKNSCQYLNFAKFENAVSSLYVRCKITCYACVEHMINIRLMSLRKLRN